MTPTPRGFNDNAPGTPVWNSIDAGSLRGKEEEDEGEDMTGEEEETEGEGEDVVVEEDDVPMILSTLYLVLGGAEVTGEVKEVVVVVVGVKPSPLSLSEVKLKGEVRLAGEVKGDVGEFGEGEPAVVGETRSFSWSSLLLLSSLA